ncbi:MAG: AAA-like domain-containing protein [Oscillatoria sp. PMC 1068.18]|nr:AAA-like domain-containing protein [Oscillatoria sp. PMC 1076.18]MEC4991067.1 AAA-like domain-containing protein [Oscillatoria sp. PMC 1068.18]
MNQVEFTQAFVSLTPRQEEVLLKVLAGEKDPAIASQLHITKDTVRKHVENICKAFALSSREDSGCSHRPELISLFAKYRPDLFNGSQQQNPSGFKIVLSYHQISEAQIDVRSQLETALKNQGYELVLANNSLRSAVNGLQLLYSALNNCDCLLLLLSPLAACSEMVTEEVRLVKTLRESKSDSKPAIVSIRLNCPLNLLNHDLRGYLQGTPLLEWNQPADTPNTIQNVFELLAAKGNILETAPLQPTTPNQFISPYAAIPNRPPQPVAEPELPRGQVELASAFYIERPRSDRRSYEAISKPGALIRIKAPRQMGKTSLMARIMHHAQLQGYATVPLSFQLADRKIFRDLELFLKWFSINVALQLQLPDCLDEYWHSLFGYKVACKSYFEKYLLANINSVLVLGLDELDVIFKYPEIAADFFGLLRAWHEEAKNREIWKKLRLIVVHSTEVYVPMDINQSPFNVGLPVELSEFKPEMVADLAGRHGLAWSQKQIDQLMSLVGGHPYLIRLALYHLSRQEITLTELLKTAATNSGLYHDHLRRHLWNLEQHPELAAALKIVVNSDTPVQLESMESFKLHSLGLVNLQGNRVTPRSQLYRQYFQFNLASLEIVSKN